MLFPQPRFLMFLGLCIVVTNCRAKASFSKSVPVTGISDLKNTQMYSPSLGPGDTEFTKERYTTGNRGIRHLDIRGHHQGRGYNWHNYSPDHIHNNHKHPKVPNYHEHAHEHTHEHIHKHTHDHHR
ncbi:hypothetical protein BDZ94DRAFT_1259871 [Collybia nuda]|uniref:Uncharacterized protein n=1 Tax=Collybia nuda TaxID=64659 RepID=A0A9P6CEI2_9AGAR|nr:hypothetical protein BDZ94DRAFT_1259871 [Collybia nuda]